MYRAQIVLEKWQHDALKALAARQGKSMSAVVRQLVSEGLRPRRRKGGLEDIAGIVNDPTTAAERHDEYPYGLRRRG